MSQNICPQCGAPIDTNALECRYCGEKISRQQMNQQQSFTSSAQPRTEAESAPQFHSQFQSQPQFQSQVIIQQTSQTNYASGIDPNWPIKSKIAAGILAILFGGIGIHKFYLGKIGAGILCLFFAFTGIPAIIGVIEGIVYLCSSDESFQRKHHVRLS